MEGDIAMSEKTVGLIILTEIPDKGLVAVLRVNGFYNLNTTSPEPWPGGCRVTVYGELSNGETFLLGLRCEIEEEFGHVFINEFWPKFRNSLVEVSRVKKQDREIVTFAVKIDRFLLASARLKPNGGIRFLMPCSIYSVRDIRTYPRQVGIFDRSVIAMFSDEKEAVGKAFEHFLKVENIPS